MRVYHINSRAALEHSTDAYFALINNGRPSNGENVIPSGDRVFDAAKDAFDRGFYTHVADVAGEDLEDAWQFIQNLDRPWSDNPRELVVPNGDGPFRSMMVGDLVERDGTFFIVSNLGFMAMAPEFTSAPEQTVQGPRF